MRQELSPVSLPSESSKGLRAKVKVSPHLRLTVKSLSLRFPLLKQGTWARSGLDRSDSLFFLFLFSLFLSLSCSLGPFS